MHNAAVTKPEKQAAAADLGEALGELGQLPKSKTGRLLIRSAIVGFLLVFVWIFAIVYLQWREHRRPDFRALVETHLLQLRDQQYDQLYANSSPRFQELVRFETFADRMGELTDAVGRFREIASIDSTEMYRGPSGLTTYIRLRLMFEKGICQAAMSFHRTGNKWRLLEVSVSLPPDIAKAETTEQRRQERSKAPPEVQRAAERVLTLLHEKKYQAVWDEGAPLFRQSITPVELAAVEQEHKEALGEFVRLIHATATQSPAGTGATLDGIGEYEQATARISMGFERTGLAEWRLAFYQVVLPMPRIMREALPSDEDLLRETQPKR